MIADPLKILSRIHLPPLPGLDWLFPETCMMKRASRLLQRLRDLGLLAEKLELARKSRVSFHSLLSHLPPLSLGNKDLSLKAARLLTCKDHTKKGKTRKKENKDKRKKEKQPNDTACTGEFLCPGQKSFHGIRPGLCGWDGKGN